VHTLNFEQNMYIVTCVRRKRKGKFNDDNIKFLLVRRMNMIVLYYRTVSHKYLMYNKMSHHAKLRDHRRLS